VHVSVVAQPDDSFVVVIRGTLDLDSTSVLSTTLDQVLLEPVPRIVVDLSGIEFCDSGGLSAFVIGHNRAAARGGWLRLAAPGEFLRRLLDTARIPGRLPVYASVTDAQADRGPY
jgi:anti-sigma B factor antagonist